MKAKLRKLVEESGMKLSSITTESGVNYYAFRRWFKRETKTLDADDAQAVYELLTKKKNP